MQTAGQHLTFPLLIRFAKTGLMRFIGHLDWQALQQAVFLRAGLGIAVGEGPTHRLRIKTSPPTPVGVASRAEFTHVLLAGHVYPEEAKRRLDGFCPEGVGVVGVADAGRLARKNPFAAIEAAGYNVEFGNGVSSRQMDDLTQEFERIQSESPPDGIDPEEVRQFWGRVLSFEINEKSVSLLAMQREGETFHAARCAGYLEKQLQLPHYPIFTKLDYYRLKPSKRRLFG